jgi:hypothetical protein
MHWTKLCKIETSKTSLLLISLKPAVYKNCLVVGILRFSRGIETMDMYNYDYKRGFIKLTYTLLHSPKMAVLRLWSQRTQ